MKIYKLTFGETDTPESVVFHESVIHARNHANKLEDYLCPRIERIDLPSDKAGVVEWLNENWPQETE